MGRSLAIYSLLATVAAAGLLWAFWSVDLRNVEAFYGFAETFETEVSLNYPVEVEAIFVEPGDRVDSGEVLMLVRRAREEAVLADQPFRIEELRAEAQLEKVQIQRELEELRRNWVLDSLEWDAQLSEARQQLAFRQNLLRQLDIADTASQDTGYRPLQQSIRDIQSRQAVGYSRYLTEKQQWMAAQNAAAKPFEAAERRLNAEKEFATEQAGIRTEIKAPTSGLVGSIEAKIAEHKSSFSPLIIFYQPHPTQVIGYVHEDKLLEARVGDSVHIQSLASPEIHSIGIISGLGSRIVEIPSRLRKLPDIRTYGREVQISIPPNNGFLQKEKVELSYLRRE